jgi:hypothetical protein
VDDVRVEQKRFRLLFDGRDDARVTVADARHRVPPVEVEIAHALRSLHPRPAPALDRERKLLVRRELKLLLARGDVLES